VHRLVALAWRPPALTLLVACSKGTYIRSLARDIGADAGPGGAVGTLCRLRSGPYALAGAVALAELEATPPAAGWGRWALPPDSMVPDWPAVSLDADASRAWRHGIPVAGPPAAAGTPGRVYLADGQFAGSGRYDAAAGRWRPDKVLSLGDDGGL
jgi:tRNA pseudouridine55 synthase